MPNRRHRKLDIEIYPAFPGCRTVGICFLSFSICDFNTGQKAWARMLLSSLTGFDSSGTKRLPRLRAEDVAPSEQLSTRQEKRADCRSVIPAVRDVDHISYIIYQILDSNIYDLRFCDLRFAIFKKSLYFSNCRSSIKIIDKVLSMYGAKRLNILTSNTNQML